MGSLEELRELNRLRVVDELRRRGNASRGEIADATGLSRTTVTTLVADLQERGLVIETGANDERHARGRPPVQLRLDPSAGAAIGADFGHSHVHVAVSDLSASVLGVLFVGAALRLRQDPSPERAIQFFTLSNLYLSLLFLAVALSLTTSWGTSSDSSDEPKKILPVRSTVTVRGSLLRLSDWPLAAGRSVSGRPSTSTSIPVIGSPDGERTE